jgi:hypothetical protein
MARVRLFIVEHLETLLCKCLKKIKTGRHLVFPFSSRNIFMGIALVRGRFACRQMFLIYILIVTALVFLLLGFEVVAFWLFVAGW